MYSRKEKGLERSQSLESLKELLHGERLLVSDLKIRGGG